MNSLSQEITRQFYEWEQCGRGWFLYDDPVQLEPPFEPFYFYYNKPYVDDGKHDSLPVLIWKSLFGKKEKPPEVVEHIPAYFWPYNFENDDELIFLAVTLPKDDKAGNGEMEQLLVMLSFCKGPVSFEIIATASTLTLQFVCRDSDQTYIRNQIKAYFPAIQISEYADDHLFGEGRFAALTDFGFREEFMRPIATIDRCNVDPFTSLFATLNNIERGDLVAVQILFAGTLNPWSKVIIDAVSDSNGKAFFEDAPDMLPLAKEKVKHPLFGVTIRAMCQSDALEHAKYILQQVQTTIIGMTRSNYNCLIPLDHLDYHFDARIEDLKLRQSRRLGMLMNSKELGMFVHFPNSNILSSKFNRTNRKTVLVPSESLSNGIIIGDNEHDGKKQEIKLSNAQRLKHTHIIGATGTGKSTLLLSMICQDIANGEGVAVLDPHGDLIEGVISKIPKNRVKDVIIFDPSDSEYPINFNVLKAHTDIEKEVLSSDLVAAFRRLSTSWGDQMNSVFANAILAFLESSRGGTLADLRRFLIEKPFREECLRSVHDSAIRYYWQKEYPLLKTNSIGPILTRLDTFLRPRLIRNMVSQQKGIDFEELLNAKKILLVKLSQGLIGAENSFLLGTFVVSKIHQAAIARQTTESRNDFFLYIDEFQHFITPSMSHILSGARKYHLGLILAHQDLQQLQKYDSDLLHSIITNTGTRICFRLGDTDAKKVADGFSFFETKDLQSLRTGEAIVRIERPENSFSLSTIPFNHRQDHYADKALIIEHSRNQYATQKNAVEKLLNEILNNDQIEEVREKPQNEENKTKTEIVQLPNLKRAELTTDETLPTLITQKEETQHRYLQNLIKKMAESKGYRAILEASTIDQKGKVDVSIENDKIRIACEVSVTTDCSWELHNIEKCLASAYDRVFVCCTEKRFVTSLQSKINEKLAGQETSKIVVCEPQALFDFLDQQNIEQLATETKIKGYRVKVEYDSISHEEQAKKKESVAKIVLESLRKMKK